MKGKASLRNQLFLSFTLLLLLLVIIIGTTQHFVMEQYLTTNKIALVESKYHIFMDEEAQEEKIDEESQKNSSESENENGDEGGKVSQIDELKDPKYVLDKLVDRDVSAAYIDLDGNVLGRASYSPGDVKRRDLNTIIYNSEYMPILSKSEYGKRISNDKPRNFKGMTYKEKDIYGNEYLTLIRPLKINEEIVAFVQLSTPFQGITSILVDQLRIFALVSFVILILGIILIRIILNYALKPMKEMSQVVEQISVGNLDVRIDEEKGQEEINKLANSFNGMLERLESAFQQELDTNEKMRRFVSDASHELRTPLTSIHGFVEVLLRGAAKDQEQLEQALNSILMESERLGGLVNDLLTLTKLEREKAEKKENRDLRQAIYEIEPQLKVLVGERGLILDFNKDQEYLAYINENHIKQVVYNLIHNGAQHTDKKDGVLSIRLENKDKWVELVISDNGTGIPEKDCPHIFDRFYRVEGHRSRKQGGNGLGLSIVKSIIDSHNGTIEVESALGKGSVFRVLLPK